MTSHRDQKKRRLFYRNELKRLQYKVLSQDLSFPKKVRFLSQLKLTAGPAQVQARLQARCVLSGRSHSVYQTFGLSRIALRELGHQGLLLGVSKASW